MDKEFADRFTAEWQATLLGVDSISPCYMGARGRQVAEVFHFDPDQVVRAEAHYGI